MSSGAIVGLPFFILWNNQWQVGWGFWISLLFILPMIPTVYSNLRSYAKRDED